uniref:Major facilitator superfamily (MFS) profile domain-containing protein n=1 Tax=Pseudonaja textilis TaxID=8673 RepID=A0A670YFZ9_PSETE
MDPMSLGDELTRPLMTMTIILTFGSSFQYGYNLWVVNHPAAVIQDYYNITLRMKKKESQQVSGLSFLYTFTSVIYSLGGLTGDFLCVYFSFRKGTLVIANLLSFISAIFMGFSTIVHTYEYAIFSRLLSGVCSGIFSSVIPMYLLETSPLNMRGSIGMVPQFFLVIGVQLAQIFAFPELLGTVEGNSISS